MVYTKKRVLIFGMVLASLLMPIAVQAHVKWFTDPSVSDAPISLQDAITPTFLAMTALTFFALAFAVFLERQIRDTAWYKNIVGWFIARREYSTVVMRIGLGMTLLLSWQAETLLVPQLNLTESWLGWAQFVVVLLLLLPRTTPLAGAGTLFLFAAGVVEFGGFYMLDYFLFVGVGIFLLLAETENIRIKALRIPALYFAVGFSLFWVGLEKIIYPQWGLYVLEQNPELTLGFDPAFFLVGAAFVELALGYLLIIGLLERPLALTITLVFFLTTLIFGRLEIVGHTIIHASLIVFLLEGPGKLYPAPVDIHKRLPLRMAFASVNFLIFLAVLIVPYSLIADAEYDASADEQAQVQELAENNLTEE
ncbi:MAG: DoxX family membrane protein [Aggregatilineales bacterium]